MTDTLEQKHPTLGTREFRIVGDEVRYAIDSPVKTESLSVVLNVLDSEPVISGNMLAFVSRVNQEPLVEMFVDRPDKQTVDRFVEHMSSRIREEDFSLLRVTGKKVDSAQVHESIDMLKQYVDPNEIAQFLDALKQLKVQPDDRQRLSDVADAFNALGFVQGQVITYAPYINFLLSHNGLGSDELATEI